MAENDADRSIERSNNRNILSWCRFVKKIYSTQANYK
jgi:hypothetical protein